MLEVMFEFLGDYLVALFICQGFVPYFAFGLQLNDVCLLEIITPTDKISVEMLLGVLSELSVLFHLLNHDSTFLVYVWLVFEIHINLGNWHFTDLLELTAAKYLVHW
jgi:hypothetical protein